MVQTVRQTIDFLQLLHMVIDAPVVQVVQVPGAVVVETVEFSQFHC